MVLGDAVETPEKIEVPPRAAQLPIRDATKAQFFLLTDEAPDLAVLDGGMPAVGEAREFAIGEERFLGVSLPVLGARNERVGSLVVFRSLDAAVAPVRQLRTYLLVVGLGGILLAVTFSVALTRTVTRPVSRLLEETGRLGAGNLDEPIRPLDDDEIGMLATGFERMRVSLKDARAELIRRERLSAVGQAASALVHDFAQPVTLISAHAEFLAMSEGDAEADRQEIEGIRSGVRSIQTMMREVLDSPSIVRRPAVRAACSSGVSAGWVTIS